MPLRLFQLILCLFCCSCVSYKHDLVPNQKFGLAAKSPNDVQLFFAGMEPEQPYVEHGIFSIRLRDVDSMLFPAIIQADAAAKGFDGALLQERHTMFGTEEKSHTSVDFVGMTLLLFGADVEVQPSETYYYDEDYREDVLTYSGISFVQEIKETDGYLDHILIERSQEGKVVESCTVFFDWNGQLDSLSGSKALYESSKIIQPWFFLDQKGVNWSRAKSEMPTMPYRKLQLANGQITYKPRIDYAFGWTYHYKNTLLQQSGDIGVKFEQKRPYPVWYRHNGQTDSVYTIHLGDLIKEQLWERKAEDDQINYRYYYKSQSDLPREWVIQPGTLD